VAEPGSVYESASIWNQHHQVGTPVSVRLVNGTRFETETTSAARQWGTFALVTLKGRVGMWSIGALTALAKEAAQPVEADATGNSHSEFRIAEESPELFPLEEDPPE